jgi:ribosomal protein S18 acetylase RimI-like enzyme
MKFFTIRKATSQDVDYLQRISRQTFAETFADGNSEANLQAYLATAFATAKLTAELADPDSGFYFAELDSAIIGYLKVNTGAAQTELPAGRGLEIERIYVAKAYLGQRVGQLLYEQALQLARQQKAAYVWLGVWEENLRAIRFYQKNGFVEFDKHLFKLGDDEQTDLMLKLDLATT